MTDGLSVLMGEEGQLRPGEYPHWPQRERLFDEERLAELVAKTRARFEPLAHRHAIEHASMMLSQWYLPLAAWLSDRQARDKNCLVVGINGAQGSGKSTLGEVLQVLLSDGFGLNVTCISIDDLYLTAAERKQLATDVHPLLATRGVPGTHDTDLGIALLKQLKSLSSGESLTIPRFDKSIDDRAPQSQWSRVSGPLQVVILEGWCVGSKSEPPESLADPINALEGQEDVHGVWRSFVNEQLAGPYRGLFALLDVLLMLRAPSFDVVFDWRAEQEQVLRDSLAQQGNSDSTGLMDDTQLKRFIAHYERITRHTLSTLPASADLVFQLDNCRHIQGVVVGERP